MDFIKKETKIPVSAYSGMLWIELQAKRHIAEVTKAAAVFSIRVKTRKEKETAQKEKRIIPRYPQKN